MLPYKRSERVGQNLRKEISDIIMNRVKDPRLGFLTITSVETSSDLKSARVYVSILKESEREESMEALGAASSFIRHELSKRVRMKVIPALNFILDTSPEYADKMNRMIKEALEE